MSVANVLESILSNAARNAPDLARMVDNHGDVLVRAIESGNPSQYIDNLTGDAGREIRQALGNNLDARFNTVLKNASQNLDEIQRLTTADSLAAAEIDQVVGRLGLSDEAAENLTNSITTIRANAAQRAEEVARTADDITDLRSQLDGAARGADDIVRLSPEQQANELITQIASQGDFAFAARMMREPSPEYALDLARRNGYGPLNPADELDRIRDAVRDIGGRQGVARLNARLRNIDVDANPEQALRRLDGVRVGDGTRVRDIRADIRADALSEQAAARAASPTVGRLTPEQEIENIANQLEDAGNFRQLRRFERLADEQGAEAAVRYANRKGFSALSDEQIIQRVVDQNSWNMGSMSGSALELERMGARAARNPERGLAQAAGRRNLTNSDGLGDGLTRGDVHGIITGRTVAFVAGTTTIGLAPWAVAVAEEQSGGDISAWLRDRVINNLEDAYNSIEDTLTDEEKREWLTNQINQHTGLLDAMLPDADVTIIRNTVDSAPEDLKVNAALTSGFYTLATSPMTAARAVVRSQLVDDMYPDASQLEREGIIAEGIIDDVLSEINEVSHDALPDGPITQEDVEQFFLDNPDQYARLPEQLRRGVSQVYPSLEEVEQQVQASQQQAAEEGAEGVRGWLQSMPGMENLTDAFQMAMNPLMHMLTVFVQTVLAPWLGDQADNMRSRFDQQSEGVATNSGQDRMGMAPGASPAPDPAQPERDAPAAGAPTAGTPAMAGA